MKISGAGCCLYDYLYKELSFRTSNFQKYLSETPGDGGLTPGELVFTENLARYKGLSIESCLKNLTEDILPDLVNMGGPAVVSLIHASQVLTDTEWETHFYTCMGSDSESENLLKDISRTSLVIHADRAIGYQVPSTVVLSDPSWHNGAGERTFINTLGSALAFDPDFLNDSFFSSDICLWGGTALVPPLHDHLGLLTKKVKERGGFNIVGTVYDFRSQADDPRKCWPLGTHEDPAYPWIDILITDKEEARRLSLKNTAEEAADFFLSQRCGACVITQGKDSVFVKTGSDRFKPISGKIYPVSEWVNKDLKMNPGKRGDTTGCGDNFMGGILVSIANQLSKNIDNPIDLEDAVVQGNSAGGLALYQMGGVYTESVTGEKKKKIDEIKEHYMEQLVCIEKS